MSEPLHIISLGAGVQSSAMALMAAAGEITPMPHCAIFADTQDEPASVYKWLDWLEPQLPFPVHRVTAGSLSKSILTLRKSKKGSMFSKTSFPAFTLSSDGTKAMVQNRACTRDFKLIPIQRKVKELAGIKRGGRKVVAVQWIGITLDEVQRMKTSRNAYLKSRWPLIELEMTRNDCLRWMEAKGFPAPPRSACTYCPFHSDAEWRRLKTEAPADFEKALQFEKALNFSRTSQLFLHRSCKPLAEVDFSTDTERGQGMLAGFGNECEGMCGT